LQKKIFLLAGKAFCIFDTPKHEELAFFSAGKEVYYK